MLPHPHTLLTTPTLSDASRPQFIHLPESNLLPFPQNASKFFSLVGINSPALKLDQTLDYYKSPNMTFRLLARVGRSHLPESWML